MSGYIGSKTSVTLVDGYTQAEADAEFVQDPNGAITVSGSNVGIGTSSPTMPLSVSGTGGAGGQTGAYMVADFYDTSAGAIDVGGGIGFRGNDGVNSNVGFGTIGGFKENSTSGNYASYLSFKSRANAGSLTERMRIDSSGNVLVGQTTANSFNLTSGFGFDVRQTYGLGVAVQDNPTAIFNRTNTDGDIAVFRKDGSTVGSIGSVSGDLYLNTGSTGLRFFDQFSQVIPCGANGSSIDNAIDLGRINVRFDDVYATNGSIQTSDRNEKQDVAALTATEMLVAARISGLFKTFRWIDSVADKGDNARTHTGVMAQDVQAAFIAEGLDAGDYALFTSATWWETQTDVAAVDAVEVVDATYDDDGNELTAAVEAVEAADAYTRTDTYDTLDEAPDGATERTRMGIRYPELLAFVGAYNEQRFASIETRLAALEGN